MGSLPGTGQLRGLVKAIASLPSLYSCPVIPSSANFPVFWFMPWCWLKVSGLLGLAGSRNSLFISSPVFFIHHCPRALTQRGAELFMSTGGLEQQALSARAVFRTGLAVVDKVRYLCSLNLLQHKHLQTSVLWLQGNSAGAEFASLVCQYNNEWMWGCYSKLRCSGLVHGAGPNHRQKV